MNIGIDIDGVILNSENAFRTAAELYNTIKLNNKPILAYDEPTVQKKYNWTSEELNYFAENYFLECSKKSNVVPYVKEVTELLKKEGHNLIIITARGMDKQEMIDVAVDKFNKANLNFDKYYWACQNKDEICVKEQIDVMIDDNYENCLKIANQNINVLYFREAGIKRISHPYITEVHNWGEVYKEINRIKK